MKVAIAVCKETVNGFAFIKISEMPRHARARGLAPEVVIGLEPVLDPQVERIVSVALEAGGGVGARDPDIHLTIGIRCKTHARVHIGAQPEEMRYGLFLETGGLGPQRIHVQRGAQVPALIPELVAHPCTEHIASKLFTDPTLRIRLATVFSVSQVVSFKGSLIALTRG